MSSKAGKANIGVVGLAVMGANLARNLAGREGNTVAVFNRSPERTRRLVSEHPEAGFVAGEDIADFVRSLARPRTAIVMVQAGAGTDAVMDKLKELIHEGNVRRVVIQHEGRTVAEFPLTAGVVGTVLAPVLAAVGALVALLKDCTIKIERVVDEQKKAPEARRAAR